MFFVDLYDMPTVAGPSSRQQISLSGQERPSLTVLEVEQPDIHVTRGIRVRAICEMAPVRGEALGVNMMLNGRRFGQRPSPGAVRLDHVELELLIAVDVRRAAANARTDSNDRNDSDAPGRLERRNRAIQTAPAS